MKPLGAVGNGGVDLTHAAVQVRAGVLCLAFRSRDPAGPTTYILRFASNSSQGPATVPSALEIIPSTSGVLWHPQGVAEAEEAALANAYRRRGLTINVAIRVNVPFPRGIRTSGLSFNDFRWRLQSKSEPAADHQAVRIAVDCVPDSGWISYPSGQPAQSPPLASAIRSLRCNGH
jgi:hypothetical protein